MAGLKILIVDDEPLVSDLIRRKLTRLEPGFEISVVVSGQECLDYLRENRVDCILSDYQMPGMDGMELLGRIREAGDETPFIFVTGQGSEDVAREAFKNGAYDYFTKEIGFAHFDRISNSVRQSVSQRLVRESRLRAERDLAEEKNKLGAIIAGIGDGITIIDTDFRLTYQNAAYERLLGSSLGERCYSFIHGTDEVCEGCPVAMTFADGQVHTGERSATIKGREVFLEVTASPLRDADGNIVAAVKLVRDLTERWRSVAALRESEDNYRLLFEFNPQPMMVFDNASLSILAVNDASVAHYGYTREEFLSMTIADIRPPEDIPLLMDTLKDQPDGIDKTGVFRHLKKDGTIINVEITSHPIEFEGRKATAALVEDVTERARFELERQHELDTLVSILENLGDPVYACDLETYEIIYANRTLRNISDGGLVGRPCHLALQGTDEPCEFCTNRLLARSKGATNRREQYMPGLDRLFDLTESAIDWPDGRVVRLVQARDITDRNRSEQEILRLSRQNRLMLESAGEGIYGLDVEGRVTFINRAALELTGWSIEDIAGMSQHDLVHHSRPDGSPYAVEDCPIYDAFKTGTRHEVTDEVFWRKDGTSFPVEYTSTPIVEGVVITGAVVVFRDITERKAVDEALRQAEGFYREAEAITKIGNWQAFADGHGVLWSDGMFNILGISREEFGGTYKAYLDFVHPDDLERVKAEVGRSLATGAPLNYQTRIICADGAEKVIQVYGTVTLGADGRSEKIFGTVQDITDVKATEDKIRESQDRYHTLMEDAGDAILLADAETGIIVEANRKAGELFGLETGELIGMHQAMLHPEGETQRYADIFRDHVQKGGALIVPDLSILRSDGGTVPVEISGNIIELGGRKIVQGIFRDITERKAMEDALRQAEAFYKQAEVITKIGNWQWLSDRDEVIWSDGMYTIFGITREEFGGTYQAYLDFVHPDDLERVMAEVGRSVDAGEPLDYQTRIVCPDATLKVIQAYGTVSFDPEGKPIKIFGTVQDITGQKAVEDALLMSRDLYKRAEAVAGLGNWEWVIDRDEVVRSDGLYEILGAGPQELGSTFGSYLDMVHPDDRELVRQASERSMSGEGRLEYTARIIRPDGTERTIHVSGDTTRTPDGRPERIFGVVQDITERRALEKQRDELFAMIRHDFKTPLAVISGNADMLMLDNGPNLERDSYKMLEAVKTSAQSLSRMLDDLAEISRLETLSLEVNRTPVDVTDLLLEASFIASERASSSGISYARELPDGLPTALISRSYVQRAVTNMLDNALKYTPPGGSVRLDAAVTGKEGGRSLEISVSDTGPGIPDDEQSLVFEKYYRSRQTQHKTGSGLGLAIVKAVASVHGGSVELTSREGHGSTFTLRLPLDV